MSLLAGKRVVVTGAGSGIGRETALVCAREGASVGALDVDGSAARATVEAVAAAGGSEALALEADLRDVPDCVYPS